MAINSKPGGYGVEKFPEVEMAENAAGRKRLLRLDRERLSPPVTLHLDIP